MKTVILAFAAIVVIAVGADLVLDQTGFSTGDVTTGSAVRLDDKGA